MDKSINQNEERTTTVDTKPNSQADNHTNHSHQNEHRDDAKRSLTAYYQRASRRSLNARLGDLGAYLGGLYQSNITHSSDYRTVDLQAQNFGEDAFHSQGGQVANVLLGARASSVHNVLNKVVGERRVQAASDALFDKVAEWAGAWALSNLKGDKRFGMLDTLSDAERDSFAYDIANQNRALATLGGVTGFAGIVGVAADSAWLLLVSLKSVYQLAHIYQQPLQGRRGVSQAYGVLAGANLDKLQEKQVLLTALALGKSVLHHAKDGSLKDEILKIGSRYQSVALYTKQIDELARFVNLDKVKLPFLRRFLPLTSVAVGAHYNRELIDEVLGTALATFCPVRPALLTDATSSADDA